MKEILKLGGILFLISAICSGLVGFTNELTKEPIAAKEIEMKEQAMEEVMPGAEEFEEIEGRDQIGEAYLAIKAGQIIGYAISVAPKGYGGPIEMIVGIRKDGVVEGIKILSHSETPGLGANASDPSFTDQFKEKSKTIQLVKDTSLSDDEVSAITGATITAQSITDGVNIALDYVRSQEGISQ